MNRQICFVVLNSLLAASLVVAQQAFYGSIVGNVTDPSGAIVPGVASSPFSLKPS